MNGADKPREWQAYLQGDGETVISAGRPEDDDSLIIAHVHDERDGDLIAAAPELRDALIRALPFVETAQSDSAYKPGAVAAVVAMMRAAIERAEGEVDPYLTEHGTEAREKGADS